MCCFGLYEKIIDSILHFFKDIKNNLSNVREVKQENSYYMYKRINIPGILIEAGFISNSSDNYILRDSNYQDKLVNNIILGIISYYQTK